MLLLSYAPWRTRDGIQPRIQALPPARHHRSCIHVSSACDASMSAVHVMWQCTRRLALLYPPWRRREGELARDKRSLKQELKELVGSCSSGWP